MGIVLPNSTLPVPILVDELTPAPEPWQAARRLAGWPHLLFFDSASGPPALARYSFVTADPFALVRSRGRQVWLNGELLPATDPFAVLSELLARYRAEPLADLPPFQAGAA